MYTPLRDPRSHDIPPVRATDLGVRARHGDVVEEDVAGRRPAQNRYCLVEYIRRAGFAAALDDEYCRAVAEVVDVNGDIARFFVVQREGEVAVMRD